MRDISFFSKIYIAVKPVDFRLQIRGLSQKITQVFNMSPSDGRVLFVFTNRRKNAIRIVYWDSTGFAMWCKNLEESRFKWPKGDIDQMNLSPRDLKWLLQGVDLSKIKMHKKVEYSMTH